jgi:GNAT superfamily N-acetyltransferase
LIRGLQERAARALPAETVEYADGWWLRHAPGCSWWIGTVLPHSGDDGGLERLVDKAERFHRGRGTTPRFQITPGVCPPGLDAFLAERGYRKESPVMLMTATVHNGPAGEGELREGPTKEWLRIWHAVNGGDLDAQRALLERVNQPTAYAVVDDAAVGRVVVEDGWAGIFGMATLPAARGTGKARAVLAALTAWARTERLYLQVERTNEAAVRLYETAGFSAATTYWYRSGTR